MTFKKILFKFLYFLISAAALLLTVFLGGLLVKFLWIVFLMGYTLIG